MSKYDDIGFGKLEESALQLMHKRLNIDCVSQKPEYPMKISEQEFAC